MSAHPAWLKPAPVSSKPIELPADYTKLSAKDRKRVREEYTLRQNGKCCHCSAPLAGKPARAIFLAPVDVSIFPPNFFSWPVHLHHNHSTGMTIGAVHAKCNAVLFQYYGE